MARPSTSTFQTDSLGNASFQILTFYFQCDRKAWIRIQTRTEDPDLHLNQLQERLLARNSMIPQRGLQRYCYEQFEQELGCCRYCLKKPTCKKHFFTAK
jgi:hypothetical protein